MEENADPLFEEEYVDSFPSSGENSLFSLNPFNSFAEILDLDGIIEKTLT